MREINCITCPELRRCIVKPIHKYCRDGCIEDLRQDIKRSSYNELLRFSAQLKQIHSSVLILSEENLLRSVLAEIALREK